MKEKETTSESTSETVSNTTEFSSIPEIIGSSSDGVNTTVYYSDGNSATTCINGISRDINYIMLEYQQKINKAKAQIERCTIQIYAGWDTTHEYEMSRREWAEFILRLEEAASNYGYDFSKYPLEPNILDI